MMGLIHRGCDGLEPRELERQVNTLKVCQSFFTCQLVNMYSTFPAFTHLVWSDD